MFEKRRGRKASVANFDSELRRTHVLRLWEERLQNVDSVFAQLIFLSALRDDSGRYFDADLGKTFPAQICHQMLSQVHRDVFRQWLSMSARCRISDLRKYNDTLLYASSTDSAVREWPPLCRALVPSGISITELTLYFETMDKLAHVVLGQHAASSLRSRRIRPTLLMDPEFGHQG